MGVLDQYGPDALKYWGVILASAEKHLNVADMWQSIRDQQQQYGLPAPGATAPDVMVLRGYANRLVNGENALAAASPSDAITADMMGIGPYTSQDLAGIAATPRWQVQFSNQIQLNDGSLIEKWQTVFFEPGSQPQTVADLQASIETSASELAAGGSEGSITTPRGTSLGVSGIRIIQV